MPTGTAIVGFLSILTDDGIKSGCYSVVSGFVYQREYIR